ncbi:MAG: hypothetical protein M4579_006909 [Chaenotheca gracillima]|nr:MAG: hypothetical protein M4579_006909 [Chaenotheca gracillima]
MDFIVSLAHFCEVHGPTSILCTQILPISCLQCFPPETTSQDPARSPNSETAAASSHDVQPPLLGDDLDATTAQCRRPNSEPHTRNPSFSRRSQAPPPSHKSALLNQHLHQQLSKVTSGESADSVTSNPSTPLQSPPASPRSLIPGEAQYSGSLGNTEAARRYGGSGIVPSPTSAPTDSCPNCSLSIPQSVSAQLPDGAPGSPTKDGKGKNGSPVLRTREALVARPNVDDLPDLGRSMSETSTRSHASKRTSRSSKSPQSPKMGAANDTNASSSSSEESDLFSSTDSLHAQTKHSRARTSTSTSDSRSNPSSPAPGAPHDHTLTYLSTRQPTQPASFSFVRRSCIRTLSCEQLPRMNTGPLFFGDDQAGYTISFAFRLPDACARGRLRRYALICWAGREERRAARAYKDVISMFAGIAGRITDMVEKAQPPTTSSMDFAHPNANRGVPFAYQHTQATQSRLPCDVTSVSSFLSGSRTGAGVGAGPGGYPRRTSEVRAKGLAELTGKDDLFVEIHAVFVKLLAHLGRGLGGLPMGMVLDSGIRGEVGETDGVEDGMRKMRMTAPLEHKGLQREKQRKTVVSNSRVNITSAPALGLSNVVTPPTTTSTTTTTPTPATVTTAKWDAGPRQQVVV